MISMEPEWGSQWDDIRWRLSQLPSRRLNPDRKGRMMITTNLFARDIHGAHVHCKEQARYLWILCSRVRWRIRLKEALARVTDRSEGAAIQAALQRALERIRAAARDILKLAETQSPKWRAKTADYLDGHPKPLTDGMVLDVLEKTIRALREMNQNT